jgi:hypothetical protein
MESEDNLTRYPEKPRIESTEPISNPYTEAAPPYFNPYERTEPYYQHIPTIAPPPPKPKEQMGWLGIFSLCVVGFLLVGSVVYIGIAGVPWQHSSNRTSVPSPTPTTAPTATPIPTPTATPIPTPTVHTPIITGAKAPYTASFVVSYFYQAGLAPQTTYIDTSWSCCQYYPEGGAAYWRDLQTGITMDLATFASIDEAQIDGKNLADKGFSAYVQNYCLLSYGGNPSDLQSYLSIMQQVCIYE